MPSTSKEITGNRRTHPRRHNTSLVSTRQFVVFIASIVALIFLLINVQFFGIWLTYNDSLGENSHTQSWVNNKLIYYTYDIYDAHTSLQKLQLTCVLYSVQKASLTELKNDHKKTLYLINRFKPNTPIWQASEKLKSYSISLTSAEVYLRSVKSYEDDSGSLNEVISNGNVALTNWAKLKSESAGTVFTLRESIEAAILGFRTVARSTGINYLFLSLLTVVFYFIGVYFVLKLIRVENKRFQRFELLVATVGHDLRSPLQAIMSAASILDGNVNSSARHKYSNIIHSSIRTLNRLVDDMMMAVKGISPTMRLTPVNLSEWFNQFIPPYQDKAASKGLSFLTNIEVDNVLVEIDPERMSQSLGNLVDNAIKYTSSGTIWVRIRLRTQEDANGLRQLVIKVRDTGPGISKSDQLRIFKPFERGTTQKNVQGLGLGLSIVVSMAESYGGAINLESDIGKGSLFKLTLPVRTHVSPDMPTWMESTDNARLENFEKPNAKEVLIVDDDQNILEGVVGVLTEAGFAVDTAQNAEHALQKLSEHAYKMVITDIQMPGMDGFDLGKSIRNLASPAPFLIAMTAYTNTLNDDPRSSVFDGFLSKPFNDDSLLSLIEKAIESDSKSSPDSTWNELKG